jgi:hypothetical protein
MIAEKNPELKTLSPEEKLVLVGELSRSARATNP